MKIKFALLFVTFGLQAVFSQSFGLDSLSVEKIKNDKERIIEEQKLLKEKAQQQEQVEKYEKEKIKAEKDRMNHEKKMMKQNAKQQNKVEKAEKDRIKLLEKEEKQKEKLEQAAKKIDEKKEDIADFTSEIEKDKLKYNRLKLKGKLDSVEEIEWKEKFLKKELKLREYQLDLERLKEKELRLSK